MSGLVAPRGLALGPDGGLYVAEMGSGGPQLGFATVRDGRTEELFYGPTGAVSRLLNGAQERIVSGLPSLAQANGTSASSLQDIVFNSAGELFGVMGIGGTPANRADIGVSGGSFGQLVHVPLAGSHELEPLADLIAYEASANPDGREVNSNPFSLIPTSNGFLVADAGANALLTVTYTGHISTLAVLPTRPNPLPFGPPVLESVPTAVALGPDGAYYIGELTGVPFPKGAANVYRVDPVTYETSVVHSGFTNIVDLTFDGDGNLFVLQISANGLASSTGPVPGALVKIDAETGKRTTIASEGLIFPGKVVAAPNGTLYVSNVTSAPAGGHVLEISRIPWPADVNDDDELNGDDINALASAVGTGSTDSLFDLSGDGQISRADIDAWLATKGTLNGDANLDGSVEFSDFLVLANSFGRSGSWTDGDFDASGQVQFPDYTILANNFGQSAPTAAAAVPEPTTAMPLLVGFLGLGLSIGRSVRSQRFSRAAQMAA